MKICKKCHKELPVSAFHFKNRKVSDARHAVCKTCRCRQNYESRRWKRSALKIRAILCKGGKCHDCGYIGHIAAYDFHHRDSKVKKFDWPRLSRRDWSIIQKELDKCDLLCASCHRIRHWIEDAKIANGVAAACKITIISDDLITTYTNGNYVDELSPKPKPKKIKRNRREYKRQYHLKNRERILAQRKIYRQENRDRLLAQQREWYARKKESLAAGKIDRTKGGEGFMSGLKTGN